MSDTPRTDAALWKFGRSEDFIAFVRQLERELAARPEGGAWIPWAGGDCPVKVEYRLRDGKTYTQPVSELEWDHDESNGDIVAYRVSV